MKKGWVTVIILIVLVGGLFLYKNSKSDGDGAMMGDSSTMPAGDSNVDEMMVGGDAMTDEGTMAGGDATIDLETPVKEFSISGKNFAFDTKVISVKKGDKVKVTFKSTDGFHDFVIEGYNVSTKRVQTGEETVVEFMTDKTGTFTFYCSVGNHRAQGMVGKFVVTE